MKINYLNKSIFVQDLGRNQVKGQELELRHSFTKLSKWTNKVVSCCYDKMIINSKS